MSGRTGGGVVPDGIFDSAWLKWGRAAFHAQQLHLDIEATAQRHRDVGWPGLLLAPPQFDRQRHGFKVVVDTPPPLPVRWNLMLGDFASNLRACLDHLAFALVQRASQTPLTGKDRKGIYFPIGKSADDFTRRAGETMPGVPPADIAVIDRHQAYSGSAPATQAKWHTLTLLVKMVNEDKHQEIQGLWYVVDEHRLNVTKLRDCSLKGEPVGARLRLEKGAEIAFVPVARCYGPEPHADVEHQLTARPAFVEGLWLEHWMDVATVYGCRLLREFSDPPEQLATLGVSTKLLVRARRRWNAGAAGWSQAGPGETPTVATFHLDRP